MAESRGREQTCALGISIYALASTVEERAPSDANEGLPVTAEPLGDNACCNVAAMTTGTKDVIGTLFGWLQQRLSLPMVGWLDVKI